MVTFVAVRGPKRTRDGQAFAGNLLKLARTKTGVSQAELARRAGVPASTVSKIENGQRQPSFPLLDRLLAAVDLEMRTRLEAYDDHDDVLDARYAAVGPEQRARIDAQHDAMVQAFTDARPV